MTSSAHPSPVHCGIVLDRVKVTLAALGGFADPDAGLRALLNVDMGDGERLGLASGGGSDER